MAITYGVLTVLTAVGAVSGAWLVIPLLGIAAAVGLTLYFVGAIGAHLRVRDLHLGPPVLALALAGATLAATLAHRL